MFMFFAKPIEKYVADLSDGHVVGFNDVALKDIFHLSLNEHLAYLMPDTSHWTLAQYIEESLNRSAKSFTVGPVDEKPTTPVFFHAPTIMSGFIRAQPETSCLPNHRLFTL